MCQDDLVVSRALSCERLTQLPRGGSLLSKLAAVAGAVFKRMLYRHRCRRCPLERVLKRGGYCDVRVRAQVVGHQLGDSSPSGLHRRRNGECDRLDVLTMRWSVLGHAEQVLCSVSKVDASETCPPIAGGVATNVQAAGEWLDDLPRKRWPVR